MNPSITLEPAPPSTPRPADPPSRDPFRFGMRYVTTEVNGVGKTVTVPLTEWDVLHPQEGDCIVQTQNHGENCFALYGMLVGHFHSNPTILVLNDRRIDWQIDGLEPHSLDFVIFENVTRPQNQFRATFYVKDEQARPLLVIEVTSPSTRKGDVNQKVMDYDRAGVPFYLIVDTVTNADGDKELALIGYRRTGEGYVPMPVDDQKGLWIPTVRLWFRIEGFRVACFDDHGQRIPDWDGWQKRAEVEHARAEALAKELAELKSRLTPP